MLGPSHEAKPKHPFGSAQTCGKDRSIWLVCAGSLLVHGCSFTQLGHGNARVPVQDQDGGNAGGNAARIVLRLLSRQGRALDGENYGASTRKMDGRAPEKGGTEASVTGRAQAPVNRPVRVCL